jgi:hypothetical protein
MDTPTSPIIIGFTGWARNGKDASGAIARDELDAYHASFAAKLKDFLYAVDPPIRPATTPGANGPHLLSLAKVVDAVGWERAKDEYPDVRPLLVRTGTEAGREVLWDNVWVDAAMASLPAGRPAVFTDARFPNEAEAIRDAGGYLVRVTRPGFERAPDAHISETALDDYRHDFYITNDGTLDDLKRKVRAVVWTILTMREHATQVV